MRKITILYDGRGYTYLWLKPMLWAKDEFASLGYKVGFYSYLDYFPFLNSSLNRLNWERKELEMAKKKKWDILFLAYHHSKSWLGSCSSEDRTSILKCLNDNSNLLCWLDTADSTGTCLFDVLPYVDFYLKKQILKDKSLYTKKMYGGRFFCQYYHDLLGVDDPVITKREYIPAENFFLDKIRISWNLGLRDLFSETTWEKYVKIHKMGIPDWNTPMELKKIDIHYRGSGHSPLIGYQRSTFSKIISEEEKLSHPDTQIRIPKKDYQKEIRGAKSIISPFGWGEICIRDFEAFVYGATLLKPSMKHCDTWPDVYRPNETYIPIEWDFSNIEEVLSDVGSSVYEKVAQNGQELYREYLCSKHAKYIFAKHVIDSLQ